MRRQNADDLTSREREVLDLIRVGLTNEEIARRLGITLDGAKYHVSQILSKLGVTSRAEAAAVAPAEWRPWWLRAGLWAKIAGGAAVTAAAGGLAILAWGVVRTEGGEDTVSNQGPLRSQRVPFQVEGAGMEPTFPNGTLVDVLDYEGTDPQRGDIIIFLAPVALERAFIKRIIGLPGETIQINESTDEVLVDGEILTEPYARIPTTCFGSCLKSIPEANSSESMTMCGSDRCYFVLGDNRKNSSDSRQGWLVPAENILGWAPPIPSSRTPPPTP